MTKCQMFMLDLLDNLPRLRLSDDHLKAILWVMRECKTPNVPSFSALRKKQASMTQEVGIKPQHHTSSLGNHFYMNHPAKLLGLVRHFIHSCIDNVNNLIYFRTGQIPLCGHLSTYIRRFPGQFLNPGRRENGRRRSISMTSLPCGLIGSQQIHTAISILKNWRGNAMVPLLYQSGGLL
jgi:hypothetical protein